MVPSFSLNHSICLLCMVDSGRFGRKKRGMEDICFRGFPLGSISGTYEVNSAKKLMYILIHCLHL